MKAGEIGRVNEGRDIMRIASLVLLVVALGCLTTSALQLSTLEIFVSVEQGTSYTEYVSVTNDTSEIERIALFTGDWDRDPSGQNCFYEPGTIDRSLTSWIQLASPYLVLQPQETLSIPVRINVPATDAEELDGTYWGMIFVEPTAPSEEIEATGVVSTIRYGVKLYATVADTERITGVVQSVQVQQTPESLLVAIQYENTGNVNQEVAVVCDIFDRAGSVCRRATLAPVPLLPGYTRNLEIPLDPLPSGIYYAVAVINYGGESLTGGTRGFRVQ